MNTKISIASISCRSCQQRRPISSSRQHRISTKLGMQHHTYLLSLLIISFYILITLLKSMLHAFKRSCNAHIMLFFGHFIVYTYQTSEIFLQTKHLKFYFKKRNHFRDGMTRLVINTRLFTNSQKCSYAQNNWVFFDLCIPHFMVECSSKSFIMHSLEDGFVCVWFSKWQQVQNIAKCTYLFPSILP